MTEFGYSSEQREAAENARRVPGAVVGVMSRGVERFRTNRQGKTESYREPLPDLVRDAVQAAISNSLCGGVAIVSPFTPGSDDDKRFWSGVNAWRFR